MALRGGQLAASAVARAFENGIGEVTPASVYDRMWNRELRSQYRIAALLSLGTSSTFLSKLLLKGLAASPLLANKLLAATRSTALPV